LNAQALVAYYIFYSSPPAYKGDTPALHFCLSHNKVFARAVSSFV